MNINTQIITSPSSQVLNEETWDESARLFYSEYITKHLKTNLFSTP